MRNQRGNILFLILLAVILFAALSYAVTSSMRGGGTDANAEKLETLASQIVQAGTMVENTVNRALLSSNTPQWGLDFNDDTGPSLSSANNTCQSASCRIFTTSARQGMMEPLKLPPSIIDPNAGTTDMRIRFRAIPVKNVGTAADELVMFIENLPPDLCRLINLKLIGQSDNPHHGMSAAEYSGTLTSFPVSGSVNHIGQEAALYAGHRAACLGRGSATPSIGGHYMHVLIAR